jgi:hypothetical protein
MDRRVFGEFVGPRGELASYAFGWTTGSEPHVARLSIGIGVGNPGGGTFHAVAFEHEDGHAFSLTDEPFEHVPQGGPDLTADQARAHEDLPFVWWVADYIMERDRRVRWMRHWLLGTRCIQTIEVFELREPVLRIGNDGDDGLWQLIGTTDARSGKVSTTPWTKIQRWSMSSTWRPAIAQAEPTSENPGLAISVTRPSASTHRGFRRSRQTRRDLRTTLPRVARLVRCSNAVEATDLRRS